MKKLTEKDDVLKKCFDCLVKTGLENTSVRDLCSAAGVKSSSLYYWFKDKDDIVIKSTEYGMRVVVNTLFEYAFTHISDMKSFLETFPSVVEEYTEQLKFIYQAMASPQYGERMRSMSSKFSKGYDEYTDILSQFMGCSFEKLRPYVRLAIAAVSSYIIWGEKEIIRIEMNCIYDSMKKYSDMEEDL